ncbi:hypothetical protein NIES3974_39880 [Calothrix sp. NIES-3974]|nr:hypothetical protein NIES3974_39880 [Calothrix sp. NIES-3974]
MTLIFRIFTHLERRRGRLSSYTSNTVRLMIFRGDFERRDLASFRGALLTRLHNYFGFTNFLSRTVLLLLPAYLYITSEATASDSRSTKACTLAL